MFKIYKAEDENQHNRIERLKLLDLTVVVSIIVDTTN